MARLKPNGGRLMAMSVATKVVGTGLDHDEKIELTFDEKLDSVPLRDIIREKVILEIRNYNSKQREDYGLEYRSLETISNRIKNGAINIKRTKIKNEDKEIMKALQAFENGEFKVFLDKQQIDTLDEMISTDLDSDLVFLRLIPLVGG
jgi:hypothetical protein